MNGRSVGAYCVRTGVLPFGSRRLFEMVTGPKKEWWLVQTVGGLATAAGVAMLGAAARDGVTPEIVCLAAGCTATFAAINTLYVARGRIRPTYLVDAAVEAVGLAALAIAERDGSSLAR